MYTGLFGLSFRGSLYSSKYFTPFGRIVCIKNENYWDNVLARAKLSWDEENGFSIKEIK